MLLRWLVLGTLIVSGCHGDAVESASDAALVSETGACADVPGNMLVNGSFEDWVGSSAAEWNGSFTKRSDQPEHCASWAEFHNACYSSVRQTIAVATPLPVGTVLEFGASIRWIDGNREGPGVQLLLGETSLAVAPAVMLPATGEWITMGSTYTVTEPISSFAFDFEFNCYESRMGLDHAFVRIRR